MNLQPGGDKGIEQVHIRGISQVCSVQRTASCSVAKRETWTCSLVGQRRLPQGSVLKNSERWPSQRENSKEEEGDAGRGNFTRRSSEVQMSLRLQEKCRESYLAASLLILYPALFSSECLSQIDINMFVYCLISPTRTGLHDSKVCSLVYPSYLKLCLVHSKCLIFIKYSHQIHIGYNLTW